MKLPLFFADSNYSRQSEVAVGLQKLIDDPRASVRIYAGVFHALNEILRGLMANHPHKKTVYYQKGATPYFQPILRLASKEGLSVRPIEERGDIEPETLLVLVAADDPLTGELYEFDEKNLSERKIFSIQISHRHFYKEKSLKLPGKFASCVMTISDSLSLGILGARTRVDELIYGGVSSFEMDSFERIGKGIKEDKSKVLEFESNFEKEIVLDHENRLWDRAVLSFEGLNGELIQSLLKDQLIDSETASYCRWQDEKSLAWLGEKGMSEEAINGLVVIPLEHLSSKTVVALQAILSEIRSHI